MANPSDTSPSLIAAFVQPPSGGLPPAEKQVVVQFLVGYALLWIVLTAGAENDTTADAAAALAVSIAFAATLLYFASAAQNLGVLKGQ
jgi:hypothetical protein